jgi:hypothetical protein
MRSTELFEKTVALRKFRKATKKAVHAKMEYYKYFLNNKQGHGRDEVVL